MDDFEFIDKIGDIVIDKISAKEYRLLHCKYLAIDEDKLVSRDESGVCQATGAKVI